MSLPSLRGIEPPIVLLLASLFMIAGCSGSAFQLEEYRRLAQSDLAATAFLSERFHSGAVSGPFFRASVREYGRVMRVTGRTLRSLAAPPGAEAEHARTVVILSRASRLTRSAQLEKFEPHEALRLARRLRALMKELAP
jgi:hypothetical protein